MSQCENCGYDITFNNINFCPDCGVSINSALNVNKVITSISKIKHAILPKEEKNHRKLFTNQDIVGFSTFKSTFSRITHSPNSLSIISFRGLKDNIDGGFDKIKDNIDGGFDKIKDNIDGGFDKIKDNIDCSLKMVIKSTNDPNVKIIAKMLSKYSPQIAIIIANCTIAGLPYGSLITQIAGFTIQKMIQTGDVSMTNKKQSELNTSSIDPIINTIIPKLLQNSAMQSNYKNCIYCSNTIDKDAKYCSNCGQLINI
jgi:RNA polymerase subunit RPABC4/transcription elongation factor Spt4